MVNRFRALVGCRSWFAIRRTCTFQNLPLLPIVLLKDEEVRLGYTGLAGCESQTSSLSNKVGFPDVPIELWGVSLGRVLSNK